MEKSITFQKSYELAVYIIKICRHISVEKKEYVLTKQLIRSGTSVGANVSEGQYAQSRADFIHKMSVALKEANETKYWINLMRDSGIMPVPYSLELIVQCESVIKLLTASINTCKTNSGRK